MKASIEIGTLGHKLHALLIAAATAASLSACGAADADRESATGEARQLLGAGPVAAYSFDEGSGTSSADLSGSSNPATLLNGATWATGHTGSSASFDGINDLVSSGNIASLNGLTAVTVSAWVKGAVAPGSGDAIIIAKDAAFALVVGAGAAHKAQFGVKSGNSWYGFPSSTASVDDGSFHFLTGVYDGANVRVYVDGVQQASQNIGTHVLNTVGTNLQLGSCAGGPNCDGTGELWQGRIDDVRVYDRALSLAEIAADRDTPVSPPDAQAPTAPASVSATAASPTRIDLSWTAATDNVAVTQYLVFRNAVQVGTSTSTSFSDTGLAPATGYTYTVKAKDAAQNTSAASPGAAATTLSDSSAPTAPTNLVGTAVSPSQINLTWAAASDDIGVTSYRVFRGGALVGTVSTTSFADTALSAATAYAYFVVAVDAASNVSGSSASVSVTTLAAPDTTPPSAPSNLGGTAISATQAALSWSASTDNVGVSSYRVFRNGSLVGDTSSTSFTSSALSPATTYTFTVKALDAAQNLSAASSPVSVTTPSAPDTAPPSTPSNLNGVAVTSSQVDLTWTPSTDNVGVTQYQIRRNGSLIGTAVNSSYSDSSLAPSTSYTYTVTAKDAAQNLSAASSPQTIQTLGDGGGQSLFVSDNFNRPNGTLGANWTVIDSDPRVVNNHVQETWSSDGFDSIAIYTGLNWPADHYSQVTVGAATAHSGCSAIVRAKNDPVIEMYFVYVTGPLGANTRLTLAKFVTHLYTELWTAVMPVDAGDTLYLGVGGSQLTVKLNGVTLATRSDTSITVGYPGFDITDYDGQGQPGDGQCDNWEAGSFGAPPPSAPPTPTSFSGSAVSSSRIDLAWAASTGAVGYRVYRNGSEIGTSLSTTFVDQGLALGTTYTYKVAAYDGSGNSSALTSSLNVTTLGDTTPPSVPTNVNGSAGSATQVGLSWTASTDNVAVDHYLVFRNGTQISSLAGTAFSDSGLSPATTYSYAVASVDPAGNSSAVSAAVSVTTSAAPPAGGPIVSFSFDEGSGLSAIDSSGNGNNGTLLNGTLWSSGHTASALQFDGLNDWVSAGNISALNGLSSITVSAWIKGSVGAASAAGVLVAKDTAFALVVVNHKLMFGIKSGGNWFGFPASSSNVDDGAYHFVTGVYDRSNILVYVDGILQASMNIGTRTLDSPSTPLQLGTCVGGPNCDSSGEMWSGFMDDVRIYNRALTSAQIIADMSTPVN